MSFDETSGVSIPAESPLSPAILRGLGDRSYDKRKNSALEVTAVIKNLQENGERERIKNVINLLSQDFARSRNANHRKGGLIGLAASAIGLIPEIDKYLHMLIPPVLDCFDDPESRVCYYACESLYNIAKIARNGILKYFNQIFEGLCKLFAHVDPDVKNGANLLDRLIKDIVTETDSFDIISFIPLLQKYIKRTRPYIRQLLVGWIIVLDAVPDINMLDFLPDFLDGLFNMLSDNNREIRQAADNALTRFLNEIKMSEVIEFGPMVSILVSQSKSKERFNRLTAILWLAEFIAMGGPQLLMLYADLLSSIISCISDTESEIRVAASDANTALLNLVKNTRDDFQLKPLLRTLTAELFSEHVITRVASLQWINMLHERNARQIDELIDDLLPSLLKALSDPADEVVLATLQVLARLSLNTNLFQRVCLSIVLLFQDNRPLLESRGALVVRKLCVLLDCRSIYLQLASIIENKSATGEMDVSFASLMIQTLNLILLTAPELATLRSTLKQCFVPGNFSSPLSPEESEDNTATFISLFHCWSHNPVATFSLCLLSQCYDLSAKLVEQLADVDITVGLLMQIDKLVQLIESPIFVHLRLQLLRGESSHHSPLLRSLYGLLMLLPQSHAYKTLSERLHTASSLQVHLRGNYPPPTPSPPLSSYNPPPATVATTTSTDTVRVSTKEESPAHPASETRQVTVDHSELLNYFSNIQRKHSEFRNTLLKQKSLSKNQSNNLCRVSPPVIPGVESEQQKSYDDKLPDNNNSGGINSSSAGSTFDII